RVRSKRGLGRSIVEKDAFLGGAGRSEGPATGAPRCCQHPIESICATGPTPGFPEVADGARLKCRSGGLGVSQERAPHIRAAAVRRMACSRNRWPLPSSLGLESDLPETP